MRLIQTLLPAPLQVNNRGPLSFPQTFPVFKHSSTNVKIMSRTALPEREASVNQSVMSFLSTVSCVLGKLRNSFHWSRVNSGEIHG